MALISKLGKKKFALILIAVLVIVGGGTYLLKHKNVETIKVASTQSASSEKSKKKSSQSGSAGSSSSSNSGAPAVSTPKDVPAATTKLEKPYGTLVSNHHPNLGGSPAPSSEESDCHTAPGATCYIEFIKGTTVKKLPAEQADSSGVVAWNWDIKQAGLSTGSWTIQAVASLNGKTMTAQDNLNLEVQP